MTTTDRARTRGLDRRHRGDVAVEEEEEGEGEDDVTAQPMMSIGVVVDAAPARPATEVGREAGVVDTARKGRNNSPAVSTVRGNQGGYSVA